jgi:hypothetical protein
LRRGEPAVRQRGGVSARLQVDFGRSANALTQAPPSSGYEDKLGEDEMRGMGRGDAWTSARALAMIAGCLVVAGTACGPERDSFASKARSGDGPPSGGNGGASGAAGGSSGGEAGAPVGGGAGSPGPSAACTVPGCGIGGELPPGVNLGGVWIGPAGEVWSAGGAYVGRRAPNTAQWCWCAPGSTSDILTDVWGAASDDVFAVGLGGVLHFDGTRWIADQPVPVGINGVHGSGPDNVWIAGPAGWTARFDGSAWQAAVIDAKYNLNAVWVDPTGVVRVAGTAPLPPGEPGASATDEAVVLRHPGAATGDWTQEASFPQKGTASFYAISGRSPNDIWAVGENLPSGAAQGPIGFVTHFDGTAWSIVAPDPTELWQFVNVVDVAVDTPDGGAVWFLDVREGVRFDGTTWTTNPTLANTGSIDARDGVMYAVGDAGVIVRWTAQTGWIVERPASP